MPPEIDYFELEKVERESQELQSIFPALSKTYVGGEGDDPEAFIIGEAPGAQEDIRKRPFIGPCAVIRDLMQLAGLLAHVGDLKPPYEEGQQVTPNAWLTNVCKFRLPGNRNPSNAEVKAFRRVLQEEWHAVGSPALIIPVGGIALSAIFGKPMSILRAAGRCHTMRSAYTGKRLFIWPMVHPAFGIRGGPQLQELIEQDWIRLGNWRKNAT